MHLYSFYKFMMLAVSVLLLSVQCTHPMLSKAKEICRKRISRQQAQTALEPGQIHESHKKIWEWVGVSEFISRDCELGESVKALKTKLSECMRSFNELLKMKCKFTHGADANMIVPHEFIFQSCFYDINKRDKWMDIMERCVNCCLVFWSMQAEALVLENIIVNKSQNHNAVQQFRGSCSAHHSMCREWLRRRLNRHTVAFDAANKAQYSCREEYNDCVNALFKKLENDVHVSSVSTLRFHYAYCISNIFSRITECCYEVVLEEKFAAYKRQYSLEKESSGSSQVPLEIPAWLRPHMFHVGIVKKAELELVDTIVELHGAGTLIPVLASQVEEVLLPEIFKQALKGGPYTVLKNFLERFMECPSPNKEANRTTAFVGFQVAALNIIKGMREDDEEGITTASESLSTFYKYFRDNVDKESENEDACTTVIADLSKQVVSILWDLSKKRNVRYNFWGDWAKITGEAPKISS